MKKFLLNTIVLTLFTGMSIESNVYADSGSANNGSNNTTRVTFNLSKPDSNTPISPVSPENNNSKDTNGENKPTNANGPLSLDAVPTDLSFGNIQMITGQNSYNNIPLSDGSNHPMIQVSDRRDNVTNNWNVSANLSLDTKDNSGLMAEVHFKSKDSSATPIYENEATNGKPTTNQNIILNSNDHDSIPIMTADNNNGANSWADFFDKDSTTLNITTLKNINSIGEHNATITWNLTAGPGSSTTGAPSSAPNSSQQTNK